MIQCRSSAASFHLAQVCVVPRDCTRLLDDSHRSRCEPGKFCFCRHVIDSLLQQIPEMFRDTRETDLVFAPVIQAATQALEVSRLKISILVRSFNLI